MFMAFYDNLKLYPTEDETPLLDLVGDSQTSDPSSPSDQTEGSLELADVSFRCGDRERLLSESQSSLEVDSEGVEGTTVQLDIEYCYEKYIISFVFVFVFCRFRHLRLSLEEGPFFYCFQCLHFGLLRESTIFSLTVI